MTVMFTPNGKTELPFEIPLKPKGSKPLYETYHGVFVNIQVIQPVNNSLSNDHVAVTQGVLLSTTHTFFLF